MKKHRNKYPKPGVRDLPSDLIGLVTAIVILFFFYYGINFQSSILNSNLPEKSGTEIVLEIERFIPKKEKISAFVESNPDLPQNKPDPTPFFSFRNQQAANPLEKNLDQSSLLPLLNGKKESSKIIKSSQNKSPSDQKQRNLIKIKSFDHSIEHQSDPTKIEPDFASRQNSRLEIKKEANNADGFASVKKTKDNESKLILLGRKVAESREKSEPRKKHDVTEVRSFKNRPKIIPNVINGPVLNSRKSAPRVGTLGVECRLHAYGVYVQQMLQAIEEQWEQLVIGSMPYIQRDQIPNKVSYRFTLTANGRIKQLRQIDYQDNSLASDLCRQAISSRSPFGEWTDEMVKDFGDFDEITIHFSYK